MAAATTALIEQLGGPPTPANGWALGVDRIALALEGAEDGDEERERDGVFVVAEADGRDPPLRSSPSFAVRASRPTSTSPDRATKGQMKQADRVGARYALILGDGKATLRDMTSGEEREVDPSRVAEEIRA